MSFVSYQDAPASPPFACPLHILVVQMWLLTATLESYLAGHEETAVPGAILSAVLFSACGGLFLFVARVDRRR